MKRTIAAILAADVAGYSRLMAEDEEATLLRLAAAKTVFAEAMTRFGGRIFNTAGDAILAEFPSAVEALRAALAIQAELAARDRDTPPQQRVRFRMGLTIGDVVEVDGDLLGDGVNIASRLEGIAEPGGICISRSLHEAVSGKVQAAFRDLGPQKLKNLPRPVHAFRVSLPGARAEAGRPSLVRRLGGRQWLTAGIGILLVPIVSGVWYAARRGENPDGGDGRNAAGAAAASDQLISISASVIRADQLCFPDGVRVTGRIAPLREVEVRPGTDDLGAGDAHLLVRPLEAVKAGQVLAESQRAGTRDRRAGGVRSPVDGVLLQASADGAPTGLPVFRIAADAAFALRAEAPWAALAGIRPGQSATVTPLGDEPRAGRVRFVAQDLDPATQLGRVDIQLDGDGDPPPRAGQFATALIALGERCSIAAPASAIVHTPDGPTVYVVRSGKIEVRPVTTGLFKGRQVEIRSGLSENEAVVARAGAFLREGDTIRPVAVEPR
ncbi:HlyD family efflux transporter periplasmic adaptor subunit [Methylobacterium sp. J-070]|uniref:HlyD family efflux transporter periplasmic adaptor subunit n=1 Tax=Methylobacterium sp. J-070 TaxID=2836650 RepID=UPI001FB96398|nr:HlyD family efflux transporter periplasmic adaptor subunit [Methylobacterium sp. J-070]MCJ2050487.1 HlyD family efflux transporter periplasmic adaptor subunit [Methylobacterium sp. J-070]